MNKEVDTSELNDSVSTQSMSANKASQKHLLSQVDLCLEAYIGSTSITIGELGNLNIDDVIALDEPLNTAVQLRLNGVAIAIGELVAVGEKFGVRITEVSAE